MMRRLFDAVVERTVSYGCEVWGNLCSGTLQPHVIFAELAEAPWQRTCWSQVLCFMPHVRHRLDSMDEGSLHPDILSDNIHDALGNPGCCNWAAGIQKQFASLGVPSPFSGGRIRNVDHYSDHQHICFSQGHASPRHVCLGRASHFVPWCSLSGCQALHLFAVVCTARQGQHRALGLL